MAAANDLFSERDATAVTTQEIADRADVAIGTLYLYASTKAELLIMVHNHRFAAAIDRGITASAARAGAGGLEGALALLEPVITCMRDPAENGRTYMRELVHGDPREPNRREGLSLSARLEQALAQVLIHEDRVDPATGAALARVVTAVVHIATTASAYLARTDVEVLTDIRGQIRAALGPR